jgi:hypothetical protein
MKSPDGGTNFLEWILILLGPTGGVLTSSNFNYLSFITPTPFHPSSTWIFFVSFKKSFLEMHFHYVRRLMKEG